MSRAPRVAIATIAAKPVRPMPTSRRRRRSSTPSRTVSPSTAPRARPSARTAGVAIAVAAEGAIAKTEARAPVADDLSLSDADRERLRREAEARAAPADDVKVDAATSDAFALPDPDSGEAPVAASDDGAPTEPREGGRRRSRGGRGRGPREGDAQTAVGDGSPVDVDAAPPARDFAPDGDAPAPASWTAADAPMPVAAPLEEPAREPVDRHVGRRDEAPAQVAPVESARDAAPPARSEPRVEARAPVAAPSSYALPVESLEAVAESAGLMWVNSDAEQDRGGAGGDGGEHAGQAARRARSAPPPVVDEGPLVLVETKKDLSQVRLPFETGSQETQGSL